MSLVSLVEADHALMLELIEEIESEFASPEGKLNSFLKLTRLVDSHAKAEQATLLDFARGDEALRTLALESMEENALAEEFANSIRQSDDLEAWDGKAKAYCDLIKHQIAEKEKTLFPELEVKMKVDNLIDLSARYLRVRDICTGEPSYFVAEDEEESHQLLSPLFNEAGRIGYIIAWILGIPAWLLFVVFLIRGH